MKARFISTELRLENSNKIDCFDFSLDVQLQSGDISCSVSFNVLK